MTFSSENRSWLEPYIQDMAQRMGLPHWRITLSDDDPEADCIASVHIRGEARRAAILIRDPNGDMDDLRDSVIHELLHVHLHEMEVVLHQTEQHFNPAAWDIVTSSYHNQLELAICAMTLAWCRVLPLPVPPPYATYVEEAA